MDPPENQKSDAPPGGLSAAGIVAVLPQGDHRAKWWAELFGGLRVPVTKDEPDMTFLPDGAKKLCYFVDFSACDWLKPRLQEVLGRRPKGRYSLVIAKMLEEGLYPIVADNVTVVRGPRRLWDSPAS